MISLAQQSSNIPGFCGDQGGYVCSWVYDWSGSVVLARIGAWVVDPGLVMLLILGLGWLVSRFVKRAIEHFTERIERPSLRDIGRDPAISIEAEKLRAKARAETLAGVLRSVALIFISVITVLLALGQLGINLAPLIAGAGIVGVALGFGAQNAVRDLLSGIFMMMEDIYSVGDDIDFGRGRGTVEKVSLRSTSIRTRQGVVWNVPNGKIDFVANFSQLWARAQLDVEVPYECDLRTAMEVIGEACQEMWEDPEWGGDELLEVPQVKGVQVLGESGISIRVRGKTKPSVQWRSERELRLRIKEKLDEAGIGMPYPHRTLIVRHQPAGAED